MTLIKKTTISNANEDGTETYMVIVYMSLSPFTVEISIRVPQN